MPPTTTTAKVTVTLEIEVDDRWGADCSTKQVWEQAEQSAVGMVRQMRQSLPEHNRHKITIIGTPKVVAVTQVKAS